MQSNKILFIYDKLNLLNYILILKYKFIYKINLKLVNNNLWVKDIYLYNKIIYIINKSIDFYDVKKIINIFQFNKKIVILYKYDSFIYKNINNILNIKSIKYNLTNINSIWNLETSNFIFRYNHIIEKYIKDLINILPIKYKKRLFAIALLQKDSWIFNYIDIDYNTRIRISFYLNKINKEYIMDSIDEKIDYMAEKLVFDKMENYNIIKYSCLSFVFSVIFVNIIFFISILIFMLILKFIYTIKINCVFLFIIFSYLIKLYLVMFNSIVNSNLFYIYEYNSKFDIITGDFIKYIKYLLFNDRRYILNNNKIIIYFFKIFDILLSLSLFYIIIIYNVNLLLYILLIIIINIYFVFKKILFSYTKNCCENDLYYLKINSKKKTQ